ncbi:MAG: response regulator [Planctomycetes bacterium]|nr:response regulator [Planctomycetota bacterium]
MNSNMESPCPQSVPDHRSTWAPGSRRPGLRSGAISIGLGFALLLVGGVRGQQLVVAAGEASLAAESGSAAQVATMCDEVRVLLHYDLAAAAARATAARELAAARGDAVAEALAKGLLARIRCATTGVVAREELSAAVAALPVEAPPAVRAELQYLGACIDWAYDDIPGCLERLNQAMAAADDADDVVLLAHCNLLAGSVVGRGEDGVAALDRIRRTFIAGGDRFGQLEAELALANYRHQVNGVSDAETAAELTQLLEVAVRIGDRSSEAFLAGSIAHLVSRGDDPVDLERARQLIARSVQVAQLVGDREYVALSLQAKAEIEMACGDVEVAKASIRTAEQSIAGMGLLARMYDVLETGMRIASTCRDGESMAVFGGRMEELRQELSRRSPGNERARFWQQVNRMREDLRSEQAGHELALRSMGSRYAGLAWTSLAALFGMGALILVLSLRSRRRLQAANARLQHEIDLADRARAESRAFEQNLRQLERLDSVGLLAGGFAHDFNNILTGVLGNAQLLLTEPDLTGHVRESLGHIVGASQRAASLCRDILAYSRAGHSDREVVDIRSVLDGLLPIARSGFGARIEVDVQVEGGPWLVRIDRPQIEQVFLNVLVNAGDAIAGRGRITVRIFDETIAGRPRSERWFGEFNGVPRDCVAVQVTDTGQGMPAETIQRIFDPFFSTRFPGRGIGLAAAFGILRRHDGVVQVESDLGRGTCFTVYLPRAAARGDVEARGEPAFELPAAPRSGGLMTGRTVLVIDDEASVLRVVQLMLERDGCRVLSAASATAALGLVTEEHGGVDAALIDFTMPDTDGAALAALLRDRQPELPIAIMSGHDEVMVRAAVPDCPFLPKPVSQQELRATVTALLDSRVPCGS